MDPQYIQTVGAPMVGGKEGTAHISVAVRADPQLQSEQSAGQPQSQLGRQR